MKTPGYHNPTLAVGTYYPIMASGRFIQIFSITGATRIRIGLDDEPPQPFASLACLDTIGVTYKRVTLFNAAGGPVTVEIYVGDTKLEHMTDSPPALVAILTTLSNRLAGVAVMTQPVVTTVAITGAAPTLLAAASATRRRWQIEGALWNSILAGPNSGNIYLGKSAAHCTNVDCFSQLTAGQGDGDDWYQGDIYGVGDDAQQQAVIRLL
jgi:hypothetical protein